MGKLMKQWPSFSDAFEPIRTEMQKGTTVLRIHVDTFMPAVAAMLQKLSAGSDPSGANFDPGAPFMQLNEEVTEISTALVESMLARIQATTKR